MTFRNPQDGRSRARTPEDKERVRQAFIAAGRELFSKQDSGDVSLRQIAALAGYAPGAIYQYFPDRRELFAAVREHDMRAAQELLEHAIARTRNPVRRVQKLFFSTIDYWLANLDHFLVLFPAPAIPSPEHTSGQPFGRSAVVQDILGLYYRTVTEMFDSLPRHPVPARLATDTMMAAVYGSIAFPLMTRTMEWSDARTMARNTVQALVDHWVEAASGKGKG